MLLGGTAAFPLAARRTSSRKLPIGVMAGNLRQKNEVDAIALAAKIGFDAVEVTIGQPRSSGRLPLSLPENRQRISGAAAANKLPICSAYLDVLHINCLKNDPLARRWVLDGIAITQQLHARILMIVFFNKCAMLNRAEEDAVADALKELVPAAEKAGVILGFENTIPAADNARVLDRVSSNALKVFYDVGNATNLIGEDAAKSIRFLGKDRICQFHLKDQDYLGTGKVNFPAVFDAIHYIGFRGYSVIEASCPGKSIEADMSRNLAFVRKLA